MVKTNEVLTVVECEDVQITPAIEQYLEAIYSLNQANVPAIGARLAERLNIKAASVVGMTIRLKKMGLVSQDSGSKQLHLTLKGQQIVLDVMRRRGLIEGFLTDVLHIESDVAHLEANRLEHYISPALVAALTRYVLNPSN